MKSLNYTEELLTKVYKGDFKLNNKADKKEKNRHYVTLNHLQKYGFIIKNRNNHLKLTQKGIIKILRIKHRELKLKDDRHDIKKCVIIFDIPETKKRMRDLFRRCLYELGFEKIQKSVFLGPQKARSYVDELVKNCDLKGCVIIIMGKKV